MQSQLTERPLLVAGTLAAERALETFSHDVDLPLPTFAALLNKSG